MILSPEYENKFLDLIRGFPIAAITDFYVGLVKIDGTEVVSPSYARVHLIASPNVWLSTQGTVAEASTGATGEISNVANISWGTALDTWGTVNKIRFYTDISSTAYFCDHAVLESTITNGTVVEVIAGDFVITTRND